MRRTRPDFANAAARRSRYSRSCSPLLFVLLLTTANCDDTLSALRSVQELAGLELKSKPPGAPQAELITSIAFGSCNDVFADQPLWPAIARLRPDVFLWTGDIVYADIANFPPLPGQVRYRFGLPRVATVLDLRGHYALQKKIPGYAALQGQARILGIYDDHDYGQNNAGRDFPLREAAQAALLDFLDEPADSPRRTQSGAYAAYDYKTPGGPLRIVLLDTRYHRDDPGPQSDVLGPQQWRWLERQLTDSPARWFWLVSSIQILPDEHAYEAWARFPAARERLIRMLETTRPRGLVLVSGDRHLAEISRMRTRGGLDLVEITASGMTHSVPPDWSESNRFREGPLYGGLNFGLARFSADGPLLLEIRNQNGRVVRATAVVRR